MKKTTNTTTGYRGWIRRQLRPAVELALKRLGATQTYVDEVYKTHFSGLRKKTFKAKRANDIAYLFKEGDPSRIFNYEGRGIRTPLQWREANDIVNQIEESWK